MSIMSDLSIERAENPEAYDHLPILSNPSRTASTPHPSSTYAEYWRLCLEVVYAAGEIAKKDKLLMNFRDKSKAFNVKHVIEKYYGGDVENLKKAREETVVAFLKAVDDVNWYARNHELSQVSAMKLMGLLEDANTRKKFRDHINTHIKSSHPPFELDELPAREFRATH